MGSDLRDGRSLAARLVLSAAIWSALSLAVAGILLTELYRSSLERSFDARLTVYQKALIGIAASGSGGISADRDRLGEPRFLIPLTGWYWLIREAGTGTTVAASRSLFGEVLEVPDPPPGGAVLGTYAVGPSGAELRLVGQRVVIGPDQAYDVYVAGDTDELQDDINAFRLQVFATLIVFAAGLLAATVLQVRFALKPLDRIRASLAAIREGRASRLTGEFPREIAPLGQELNALIDTNQAIVERARAHVGNLAHALKTPLSVILNEARADGSPLADKVVEQAGTMRNQIDRYLDRARMAAERRTVGASADVMRSVEGVAKVLTRAYPDKDLAIETEGPADLKARVERRDLDELVGNLMDNACKFGRSRVLVKVTAAADSGGERPMLSIAVEDDGPGLQADKYAEVVGRGRRLDETVPGSGLGLSIVDELVEVYGGTMRLARSNLGGLSVVVSLPQS